MTDDIMKVPEGLRDKVRTYKESEEEFEPQKAPVREEPSTKTNSTNLYGDHPLDWWKETFNKKRQELSASQSALDQKRRYIEVFEAGRRMGQFYGATEAEAYNKYKSELPADEARQKGLQEELDELKRKAVIYGVPRIIRGE